MDRRVLLWGPVVAWMAAIFVVSGLSAPPAMPGGMSFTSGHLLAYGLLAALIARALAGGRWDGVGVVPLLQAWCLTMAYGASDEMHQSFVPGRCATFGDWLADGLGAAAALACLAVIARWRRGAATAGRGADRAV